MTAALEPRRIVPGRVPPHNLEAEESLLGAMLLTRDAINAATEAHVEPADFYKPSHAHICGAIFALYAQGESVDPVTVSEELRRQGLLDNLGGSQTILKIQGSTPASANASHYARIVTELAMLRRLIAVAGDIAESGYDESEDVDVTLDRAEQKVFELTERRVVDSVVTIGDAHQAAIDAYEEPQRGVATGYRDLDRLLLGLQPASLNVLAARPSMGKALALDTPIPTPEGWTSMGEIRVGDQILDDSGSACVVERVSPVFVDHDCFEVLFDDGSTLVADAEHQWLAYDNSAWRALREGGPNRPRVATTVQMMNEGVRCPDRPNWYLPLVRLDLPEAELPVDPYILGCWLGDGTTRASSITIGDQDINHFAAMFADAGYRLVPRPGHGLYSYSTVPVDGTGAWQGYRGPLRVLTRELQEIGLLGGASKHIPAPYLRASFKQRLALLQGLMDTDGSITNRNGSAELCLANRELLEQAHELVCSLGHKPHVIRRKEIRLPDNRVAVAWRLRWSPLDDVFRLPRKAATLRSVPRRRNGAHTRRAIASIRPVPSVPVRCIGVDSPNHVYLAGCSLIPTHNSAHALGIAAHIATQVRRPALFFSMEMSTLELTQRLWASSARVDLRDIQRGDLSEADWQKVNTVVGATANAPLHIDDNPYATVGEIRAKARRIRAKHGDLAVIVVDYVQLMMPTKRGRHDAENREVEVAEISRGLKLLARELDCPVVALAQLNRNLEYRADKHPLLADLRNSGALEQDADVVLFIYRDDVYKPPDVPRDGTAEIIVAKHRNGPTGTVLMTFVDKFTKFADHAKETQR